VQQARRDGWRSRAVYKLEQIVQKERMLKPGMTCIDLGAAPGSWSQYVTETLKGRTQIVAIDLLPMDALPSVEFIQGDFTDAAALEEIRAATNDQRVDLVMSDMAPKPRSMYLAELALDLCKDRLKGGGDFICKLFQGEGTDAYIVGTRAVFERVKVMKPKASRAGSREVYLVARNYQLE